MIPDICNPFFPELARAIQDEAAGDGYDVLIYNTDVPGGMSTVYASHLIGQLSPKRFDGALIVGESAPTIEQTVGSLSIPAVHIGHLDTPVADSVTFDDYAAAYEATAYLIGRGHTRIGHIAGLPELYSGRERRRGYEQALRDHGLNVDECLIFQGTHLRPAGAEGMRHLLAVEPRPTAVFAANALMALAALGAALDLGRKVPDDVALVGYDDISEMTDVRPQLTTVDCSARTLGRTAARLLVDRLHASGPRRIQTVTLPHILVRRTSA
jgi:LacI family transcriptional regulator